MKWTEDLSIGIDLIDSQHRELFNRIPSLVHAIKTSQCKYTIDDTIRFLEGYALHHFGADERFMRNAEYPDYPLHKIPHAEFLRALAALEKQAAEPRSRAVPMTFRSPRTRQLTGSQTTFRQQTRR